MTLLNTHADIDGVAGRGSIAFDGKNYAGVRVKRL